MDAERRKSAGGGGASKSDVPAIVVPLLPIDTRHEVEHRNRKTAGGESKSSAPLTNAANKKVINMSSPKAQLHPNYGESEGYLKRHMEDVMVDQKMMELEKEVAAIAVRGGAGVGAGAGVGGGIDGGTHNSKPRTASANPTFRRNTKPEHNEADVGNEGTYEHEEKPSASRAASARAGSRSRASSTPRGTAVSTAKLSNAQQVMIGNDIYW